ncbi:MAG: hypothetical protein NUV73_03980, partial [Candidatus Daviesbacteria bacterium]|nr:hypothetical protein [Candidatus Daviesbacteria bacterium]
MERLKTAARAILILGLPLTIAFGSPTPSKAVPNSNTLEDSTDYHINIPGCRAIQSRINEIIVRCSHLDDPEEEIERIEEVVKKVEWACGSVWVDTYRHRTLTVASIITPDENCL